MTVDSLIPAEALDEIVEGIGAHEGRALDLDGLV